VVLTTLAALRIPWRAFSVARRELEYTVVKGDGSMRQKGKWKGEDRRDSTTTHGEEECDVEERGGCCHDLLHTSEEKKKKSKKDAGRWMNE